MQRVHPAGAQDRAAHGAARHEVLHWQQLPGRISTNNIFLAEHGGWNQFSHTGARIVRIQTDVDGKNIAQELFASGWIKDNKYWGRPADVVVNPMDGSLLDRG